MREGLRVAAYAVCYPRAGGRTTDLHALRIVYEGDVTGGTLRNETDGSTDLAAWHALDAVPELPRVGLVDARVRLWRERPADGHHARPAG